MGGGPHVLLTGATGVLGRELLLRLLPGSASVTAVIRGKPGNIEARFASVVDGLRARGVPDPEIGRLSLVPGDIGLPAMGMPTDRWRELAGGVTHVLHGAADTRFSSSLERARRGNVAGTREVLAFAERCRRLTAFGFLSTLYVAGRRTGLILEDELAETTFVNAYEQSKYEAERLLRTKLAALPIAIYRVSTILGRARDGEVPRMGALHQALRLYHRGLVPMVPGDPSGIVELIDLEYAAEAVVRLILEAGTGCAYHVVGGAERNFTLEALVSETHRLFGEFDREWARRGIEPPAIVSEDTFARFERTVEEAGDRAMAQVVRGMRTFLPQLLYPKRFDSRNRDRALPPDMVPPDIREYYPRIIAWCLGTRWGHLTSRRAEVGAT